MYNLLAAGATLGPPFSFSGPDRTTEKLPLFADDDYLSSSDEAAGIKIAAIAANSRQQEKTTYDSLLSLKLPEKVSKELEGHGEDP